MSSWGGPLWGGGFWGGAGPAPTYAGINIITRDVLGNFAGKSIRMTPDVTNQQNLLAIPQQDVLVTTGNLAVSVITQFPIQYEAQLSDLSYKALADRFITGPGSLGTLVRQGDAKPTGGYTTKSITGNLFNLFGIPVTSLLLRVNQPCIDLNGDFRIPEPVPLSVNPSTGLVSLNLPSTGDLYTPYGGSILYQIVKNSPGFPIVGGNFGFTVPSTAGPFSFVVSGNNGLLIQ